MGPLPPLTTNVPNAEQFIRDQEDPLLLEAMTEAVTLMPCAHTYNEQSVWMIPGFTGQNNPHPCEGGGARITKVRVVGHINCPMCHHPVDEYYRNWALRSVCLSLPGVFNNHLSINLPAPAVGPMPAPPPPAAAAPAGMPMLAPAIVPIPPPQQRGFVERFNKAIAGFIGCATVAAPAVAARVFSKVTDTGWVRSHVDTSGRDHNVILTLCTTLVTVVGVSISIYLFRKNQ